MFKLVDGIEVPLTEGEIAEMEQREAAHLQKMAELEAVKYQELRRQEYPSLDEMLVALLEKEEGRPEVFNELMVKRTQIKNKYPKGGDHES